eukprot:CAMPEP_0205819440 /NCGR_PEP_ID=MMETSP0206-20130828/1825_1 /ASSEMBLY_ACC=CAM_ASM_000279 /TAXON_ID=36767 /ORGANISM="Euplotes focardii, Strain TN1" /LENGTH=159 /DNA_ID=CAMNT_0053113047 /DNA_START=38 /DNA_END=517 /DNA_ORIENTATION=-
MVHSYGYKSGTRHLFQKKFRKHGVPGVSTLLSTYKVGDYVDVVADPSVRKGMPHKFFHGKTGIVWNVTPRGLGVIVNKVVGTRTLRKRICVRFEHVKMSRCREAFQNKVKAYKAFCDLKKAGKTEIVNKTSFRAGGIVRPKAVETLKKVDADFDGFLPY